MRFGGKVDLAMTGDHMCANCDIKNYLARSLLMILFIIKRLDQSAIKRRILIDSLGGPNFAKQTAKMDRA